MGRLPLDTWESKAMIFFIFFITHMTINHATGKLQDNSFSMATFLLIIFLLSILLLNSSVIKIKKTTFLLLFFPHSLVQLIYYNIMRNKLKYNFLVSQMSAVRWRCRLTSLRKTQKLVCSIPSVHHHQHCRTSPPMG